MKTIKIFAVISSRGTYDDYYEWIEKCFTNEVDAIEHARNVDISHEFKTNIPDDIMNDIDNKYDEYYEAEVDNFCKQNGIPTNAEITNNHIERTDEQESEMLKFIDDLDIKLDYDNWCKDYLLKHYNGKYTEQDYNDYILYREHMYDEWHDCKIKEIELVIADDFVL